MKHIRWAFSVCLFLMMGLGEWMMVGCNGKSENPKPTETSGRSFNLNCVELPREAVQRWHQKGWFDPANPDRIRLILLQAYSQDVVRADTNNILLALPATSYTSTLNDEVKTRLSTRCTPLKLNGEVAFTNNFVNFKKLNLLNEDGTLKEFDFIRFIPQQLQQFKPYITYSIEIVSLGANQEEKVLRAGTSDPCPRYCPAYE